MEILQRIAFIFPGQGAQAIGMGRELADAFPAARAVFDEVDEALNERLSDLIWTGPEETLTLTANAQPALMAVSLAVVRVLETEFGVTISAGAFVAGHSLGEYSALAAAGSFSVADAARLLRKRGEAMQAAAPVGVGAMAALIGKVDITLAEEIAAEGAKAGVVVVANDNNVGNVVISGSKEGIEAAILAGKERGVRAVPLSVSAPFHSPLMQAAAVAMREALSEVRIKAPVPAVVANVTASPTTDPEVIRRLLVDQICGRVRWREGVDWMARTDGGAIQRFVEVGAGKQLSGMVKRIAAGAETGALNAPADLEAFAKSLAAQGA